MKHSMETVSEGWQRLIHGATCCALFRLNGSNCRIERIYSGLVAGRVNIFFFFSSTMPLIYFSTFGQPFSWYQTLYSCLALAQLMATLGLGISQDILCLFVSKNMHSLALGNVFKGKMSFFDTAPLGRIAGVFGKDIDSMHTFHRLYPRR